MVGWYGLLTYLDDHYQAPLGPCMQYKVITLKRKPLYKCLLAIREKVLGSYHPDLAESLSNLAVLYDSRFDSC